MCAAAELDDKAGVIAAVKEFDALAKSIASRQRLQV
jgi:hypothetical protein